MSDQLTDHELFERAMYDASKEGIFRDHRCWKCNDGEKPCVRQTFPHTLHCEYPHARND